MIERLLITFVVIGGLALLWWSWQYYKSKLVHSIRPAESSFGALGKPALLYFTADYCAPCKFQQAPVVEKIAAHFGNSIAVKKYDVTQHPELAGQYKVLTLPTTIVINPQGQVAHINYGVTQQAKLALQLSNVAQNNDLKQGVLRELQHVS